MSIEKNLSLLNDSDVKVRINAIKNLGKTMNPKVIPPLIKLFKVETNIEAHRVLIFSLSLLAGNDVLPILLSVLKNDRDIESRRIAAGGLRFFGTKINSGDILELLLQEKDDVLRNVFVSTMIFLKDRALISKIIDLFQTEKSEEKQACLLELLSAYDDPRVKELFLKCITSNDNPEMRLIATRAIGKFDDVSFIPHLYDLYKHDDYEEVRNCAFKILEEFSIAVNYKSIEHMVSDYLNKINKEK